MALNGTPAADNLSARFDGDAVYGLGGRDVLYSAGYNDTYLDGGVGNDQLWSDFSLDEVPEDPDVDWVTLVATQSGGTGNDSLSASIWGEGVPVDIRFNLTSGDGTDRISVSISSGYLLSARSSIWGGIGDDLITVSEREPIEYIDLRGDSQNTISAGEGNDQVTIRTTGGFSSVFINVQGEAGNDTIVADAIAGDYTGFNNLAANEITGGDGDDLIRATAHAQAEYAIWGSNVISGDAGNDTIDANSWGDNQLSGGAGDDVILGAVIKLEGSSDDNYDALSNNALDGGDGDDFLTATGYLDTREGNFITNRLTGGAGNDTLQATAFVDAYGSASNILLAGDGNDSLTGTMQAATMGANRLYGHAGNDRLQVFGGSGNLLNGGPGTDTIISGEGTDTLVGSSGNDIFRFLSLASSRPAVRDTLKADGGIAAFEGPGSQAAKPADRIDLSAIDANVASGIQHFVFGTSHAAGRLWAEDSGSVTLIRGNVNGNAAAEFEIAIEDGNVRAAAYTTADFIL